MYTFWREVIYTFIGRGRVKSNVHILEGSDIHIHWQGEGLKAMYHSLAGGQLCLAREELKAM